MASPVGSVDHGCNSFDARLRPARRSVQPGAIGGAQPDRRRDLAWNHRLGRARDWRRAFRRTRPAPVDPVLLVRGGPGSGGRTAEPAPAGAGGGVGSIAASTPGREGDPLSFVPSAAAQAVAGAGA